MSQVLPDGVSPDPRDNDTQRLRKMVNSSYDWAVSLGVTDLEALSSTDNTTTLLKKLEANLYQIALIS